MPTTLEEAIARIESLAGRLSPEEQAYAANQLKRLADELERERAWGELLTTPESQAFLRELGEEVREAIAKGEVEGGGWTR